MDTPECQAYYSVRPRVRVSAACDNLPRGSTLTARLTSPQDITTRRHFSRWLEQYQESQLDELVKQVCRHARSCDVRAALTTDCRCCVWQDLVAIESGNYCCGFGPAVQCDGADSDTVVVVTEAMVESETPFEDIKGRCFSEVVRAWCLMLVVCPQLWASNSQTVVTRRGCPWWHPGRVVCTAAPLQGGDAAHVQGRLPVHVLCQYGVHARRKRAQWLCTVPRRGN